MSIGLEKMVRIGVRSAGAGSGAVITAVSVYPSPCLMFPPVHEAPGERSKAELWLIQHKWDPRVLQLSIFMDSTTCFKSMRVITEKRGILELKLL